MTTVQERLTEIATAIAELKIDLRTEAMYEEDTETAEEYWEAMASELDDAQEYVAYALGIANAWR